MAAMKKDFGPFELHEKIGAGGMASVYRGVQKSLDRRVVLKVLYPHLAEDEKLVQRFEREARAAAMLRHENIVQVIDAGRHEDVAYIAMEFVEGMDLKKWMEQYGTPPLEVAMLLVRDLCNGLEHAHQNRIVHRDIKPANIMFTPEGVVKIMDFGLARRGEDSTAVTVVGSVMGTPAYMSPEQATGELVDERSDIFSAGVVAYELLGGTRPFLGDSYSTVLRSVLTVEPPELSNYNPLVPKELVDIVQKMLSKDVSKRYQRIAQVRMDLDTLIESLGLHRSRDLMREYAQDPTRVSELLKKKRLTRHLDQGIYFENMGLSKIDDAFLEFARVLHLDPENKVAREHLMKLEKERAKRGEEQGAGADDHTVVMSPEEMAKLVARPAAAPAAPPARGAQPARGAPAARPAAPARPAVGAPSRAPVEEKKPANTTGLLIGAAAVLVVVIGVVAWLAFGHKKETPEGDGGRSSSATSSQTQTPPSPPPPVPAQANEGGGTQTTPPAPSGGATVGSLDVQTEPPGAEISINGTTEPKKSNLVRNDLIAGDYTVKATKPGYLPQETKVTVAAGQKLPVKLTLQPEPGAVGSLTIKVSPFATFFVNDKPLGQPNVVGTQTQLPPGLYTVKAVNPNFEAHTWKNVRIEPNQTTLLVFDFLHVTAGTLKVSSPGGWAYVYIDGKNTGKTTPDEFPDLKPGDYQVTVVRDGFTVVGGGKRASIKDGVVTSLEFKIQPNP